MGRGHEKTFLQRYTGGQQTLEKMINITSHQGNGNQNCNKISHTSQSGYYQKVTCVRMWRKGDSDALLVGMQICAVTIENNMETSKKYKNRFTTGPNNSTSGYLSKENKNTYLKRYRHTYVH